MGRDRLGAGSPSASGWSTQDRWAGPVFMLATIGMVRADLTPRAGPQVFLRW